MCARAEFRERRHTSVFKALLGVEHTVVEKITVDDDGVLVAHVRPGNRAGRRCGRCGRRGSWYDRGEGRRRWRSLDLGATPAWLEAEAPRVDCYVHGPTVIAVPWAWHGAGHTRAFDDMVAWLAVHTSKTAVAQLMRVAWRTVGAIVARVSADAERLTDRLAGLRRIGIDELSYKKGHRYITCVVDHDTGRLVWAAPGRDKATLHLFFDALGRDRCEQITHVSADGADWIAAVVAERCPDAVQAADPFHVVSWATDALDAVRRDVWNNSRGGKGRATTRPKGSRMPAGRCGATRKTCPRPSRPNWTGSNAPTHGCTGRGRSRKACAGCFPLPAKASHGWPSTPCTGGCPGRGAAKSPPSPTWPAGYANTARRSRPASNTSCPTPWSNP